MNVLVLNIVVSEKKYTILTFDSADRGSVKAPLNCTGVGILLLKKIVHNKFSLPIINRRGANAAGCQ